MGESMDYFKNGHDLNLMKFIDSVNIACGFHAGSEYLFKKTLENALINKLKIGAHPGFKDIENFGRKEIQLSENEIIDLVSEQLLFTEKICTEFEIKLNHIKPHGALYNMAAKNETYARSIAKAVIDFDSNLIIYGLAGSINNKIYSDYGLTVYEEGFADRRYLSDGSLAPRTMQGSVINNTETLKNQAVAFKNNLEVETLEGEKLRMPIDTICLHSDTPNAILYAQLINSILKTNQLFD
jgi:UPF0271 protein